MLKNRKFYDAQWNKEGKGFTHVYKKIEFRKCNLVMDQYSGLTWQQSGSEHSMNLTKAGAYVADLNNGKCDFNTINFVRAVR